MHRKKVLVDIYLAGNLGDDMFLDHLANSFPSIDFIPFHPGKNYQFFFQNYDNIKHFSYSVLDKIFARFGYDKLTNYSKLSENFDGVLFLGGGIFREESYWRDVHAYRLKITKAFRGKNKKVIFSGCNFGPYATDYFLNQHKKLFAKVTKITFRDKKSYNLFSNGDNIYYAPDVLWSYNLPTATKEEKTIGVSVINPLHKKQYSGTYNAYINAHIEFCSNYINNGYQVILFSFCEKEGDLVVAKEIARSFPEIQIQNYSGNITSYLKKIGSCSHFVAARFHAVIIAFKFHIPVIPIIYGDKTENLLLDLNFEKPFVYLDTISQLLEAPFLNINSRQKEMYGTLSKNHFKIDF